MLPEVEHLEQAMQRLLTGLDSKSEGGGLETEWARCREAEEDLVRLLARAGELDSATRAELRVGLDQLMRLNAIARQSLLRGQESLAQELTKTRAGNAQAKAYGKGPAEVGGSCDLAG
jgi:uncharacterized lipoprotein